MTINKTVVSPHDIHITMPTGGKYVEEDINVNILMNEEAPVDDVIFIDYDGRRLYSYNKKFNTANTSFYSYTNIFNIIEKIFCTIKNK